MGDRNRKTLQELTIKDDFMFAAVMLDPENAKGMLERTLDMEIDHVDVSVEKSIVYNPEYKGVRLDVYAKDDKGRHFNVEMQVAKQELSKRARYYHSQIDMELIGTGIEYAALPDTYVIFICDFDPIGLGKYKYTVRNTLAEDATYEYQDGSHTIYLSTVGSNEDEVSKELVKFLKFAGAELSENCKDFQSEYVSRLQKSVEKIKFDREMGRRYMLFEEIKREEFRAGKEEGREEGRAEGQVEALYNSILDSLSDIAPISDSLKERVSLINDLDVLAALTKKAARAQSISEFEKELTSMKY